MAKWHKAYRYRIYPTKEQMILLAKTFGCCRKVYNLMLGDRIEYYEKTKTTLSVTSAAYKETYPYLKEVDSLALTSEWVHLQTAYKNFFERPEVGFPKFKCKHRDKASYTTNLVNGNIYLGDGFLHLPKVGDVKVRAHRTAPEEYKLKSVTVSMERDGTYYASVLYEYTPIIIVTPKTAEMSHIGLDYKTDGLYVASDGTSGDMPHFYVEGQKRLQKAQRKLSHRIQSHIIGYNADGKPIYDRPLSECKNINKQRKRAAKIHRHVANQRLDFLHKRSAEITNQYELVSVEGFSVKDDMLIKDKEKPSKMRRNANRATYDNGFSMFRTMLEYKQRQKGHYFIKVDKDYPSSQICHVCGHIDPITKDIRIKKWECPCCGTIHDRDENASRNIDNEGLRLLLSQ